MSEHMTDHVFFEQLVQRNCGYMVEIVQSKMFDIDELTGVGTAAEYRTECPVLPVCDQADPGTGLNVSWVIPTERENGEALLIDDIEYYTLTIRINDTSLTGLVVKGIDTGCVSMTTTDTNGDTSATTVSCVE